MAGGSSPGASLVARTVSVLQAFDRDHRRLTLTQIATRAEIPPATATRILRGLVDRDVLRRGDDGRYAIGRTLWELGLLAPVQAGLRDLAAPYLFDLHAATRDTVHLAERDGAQVLYLDRHSGSASVPVVSTVGDRLPMHATGVGKVLLAHAPQEVQAQVLRSLRPVTPFTVTNPRTLTAQLARVRKDGYATTAQEMSLGAESLAVPITDGAGEVVAALGVVVADLRRQRPRLVASLRVAAAGIGRELRERGGAGPR